MTPDETDLRLRAAGEMFATAWRRLASIVYETAVEKGWYEDRIDTPGAIALMHSELSEALEARRRGNPPDDKVPEFDGMSAEFADCVIRIMDEGEYGGLRIPEAVVAKMRFNRGRPRKHGGKEF